MRKPALALVAAAVVAATGCGGSKQPRTEQKAPPDSFPTSGCRRPPLMGVYSPDRLKLLNPCRAVAGTVREPQKSPEDEDETFNLSPDPPYVSMLNARNVEEGGIHVEIVPADQAGCVKGQPIEHPSVPGLGKCTGLHLKLPPAGAHVRVVGAYVLDISNDWNEIHPTWKITRLP